MRLTGGKPSLRDVVDVAKITPDDVGPRLGKRQQATPPRLVGVINPFACFDEQSTDALLGVIKDTHDDSYLISLEANRRLGDSWKLSIQASKFLVDGLDQSLKSFAEDDLLQIELGYYF